MKPKVSVVFLNYNGQDDAIDFLKSVYGSDYPKKSLEVIMVDNGSTDDSVKKVRQKFPQVKIIKLAKNTGRSFTRNIGLKAASGEYILSADNDALLNKSYISTLVNLAEKDSKIGIIGGYIFQKKPKTKIESTGYGFNFLTGGLYDIKDSGEVIQERQYLSGCAMLVKRKVFKKIGYFDGRFYLYFEDTDLCFRVKKAGFKVVFTPKAKFFHGKAKTTPVHPLGKYPNWCFGLFSFIFKQSPLFLIPFSILFHLTIIPIIRKFIILDPTIKVSLFEDYQIRWAALVRSFNQLKPTLAQRIKNA